MWHQSSDDRESWAPVGNLGVKPGTSGRGSVSAAQEPPRYFSRELRSCDLSPGPTTLQLDLARAAQANDHEAILTLVTRKADVNAYVGLEWALCNSTGGAIRTCRASFTPLQLLAAHGAPAMDAVRSMLKLGACKGLTVRGFAVEVEEDSSDESDQQSEEEARTRKLPHIDSISTKRRVAGKHIQKAPWGVDSSMERDGLTAAHLVAHDKKTALDAADILLQQLLQVDDASVPLPYPVVTMEQGFSVSAYELEDVDLDVQRTFLGPPPHYKSAEWSKSWDPEQGKGIGAETWLPPTPKK